MMDPRSLASMKLKRRSISRSSAARVICALTSRTAFSMAARADAVSSLSWGPANAAAVAAKRAAHRARDLMERSFSDRFVLLCAYLLRSRRLDIMDRSLVVGLAQLVERQIVVLEVVGSNPTSHPTFPNRSNPSRFGLRDMLSACRIQEHFSRARRWRRADS